MSARAILAALAIGLFPSRAAALVQVEEPERPNILVIFLDDVGADRIGCYGDPDAPATPMIDAMAASGVRFTRAYGAAVCSPTRGMAMTGRLAHRIGVGTAVLPGDPANFYGLDLAEETLMEHLAGEGYSVSCSGKWHLANANNPALNPNDQGCGSYRGKLGGALPAPGGYFSWARTVNGVTAQDNRYATSRCVGDAIEQIAVMPEPWFATVAFNSAHAPYHNAPGAYVPSTGGAADDFRSMVESADAHAGALVTLLSEAFEDRLWVILLGDNGTPAGVDSICPAGYKGLVYEGGVRIPLVVWGPGCAAGIVRDDLVLATDLFATICDLAFAPPGARAIDSISFVPAIFGGSSVGRSEAWVEFFRPNGLPFGGPDEWRRALIGDRWKLVRHDGNPGLPVEEFFDLEADPCEALNLLLGPLSAEAQEAYDDLSDRANEIESGA